MTSGVRVPAICARSFDSRNLNASRRKNFDNRRSVSSFRAICNGGRGALILREKDSEKTYSIVRDVYIPRTGCTASEVQFTVCVFIAWNIETNQHTFHLSTVTRCKRIGTCLSLSF